jgi:antitoxin PrlF
MTSAKVTSKGQITIPAEVRKALGLKAGVRVNFFQNANGEFVLSPKTGSIQDLKGCVPKLDYVPTIEEINEAIAAAATESYLKSVARPGTDASKNEAA